MTYNAETLQGERAISIACNVPADGIAYIVEQTHDIPGVDSYVIGGSRTTVVNLPRIVESIKNLDESKKVIYDHQKAGTCDPDVGMGFAADIKRAEVDSVVLFPLGDPGAQKQWIQAVSEAGLEVIVGPDVNIQRPLGNLALSQVLHQAANLGVRNFWLRYDSRRRVMLHTDLLKHFVPNAEFSLLVTRILDDDGKCKSADVFNGYNTKFVIGRAICLSGDVRESAKKLTKQLLSEVSEV